MTEQVTILAAPLNFPYSSALSAKCVIFLEDICSQIPEVVYLRRVLIWNQTAAGSGYPSGLMGDVTVAVDPDRQYAESSGFPVVEKVSPKFLKFLGALEMKPGASCWSEEKLDPPIAYRRGRDGIVFAPECNSVSGSASIFLAFSFEATEDIGIEPIPSGASDAFRMTLDHDTGGNGNICIRNLIPITAGGTQMRARFRAFESGSVVSHASVGVQGSGSTTGATPVELTFSSSSGVSLNAHEHKWSDWATLNTSQGQNLLLTCSLFNNNNNAWAYKESNGAGNWNGATDCWNVASMAGGTWQSGRTHVIDRVQVK